MFMFICSQDSTAFRSAICLSISSGDIDGIAMPGIFIDPHRFLTNSSVSPIAFAPGMPFMLPDIAASMSGRGGTAATAPDACQLSRWQLAFAYS